MVRPLYAPPLRLYDSKMLEMDADKRGEVWEGPIAQARAHAGGGGAVTVCRGLEKSMLGSVEV